jgi:hypothetical protein
VPLEHRNTQAAHQILQDRITFLVNFWHVRPKEPNCKMLKHEEVPGLTILSREEIMQMRKQEEEQAPAKPKRQKFKPLDLTPGSDTETGREEDMMGWGSLGR